MRWVAIAACAAIALAAAATGPADVTSSERLANGRFAFSICDPQSIDAYCTLAVSDPTGARRQTILATRRRRNLRRGGLVARRDEDRRLVLGLEPLRRVLGGHLHRERGRQRAAPAHHRAEGRQVLGRPGRPTARSSRSSRSGTSMWRTPMVRTAACSPREDRVRRGRPTARGSSSLAVRPEATRISTRSGWTDPG